MDLMIRTYIIEDNFIFREKIKELIQQLPVSDNYFSLEAISIEKLDVFYSSLSEATHKIQDTDIYLVDIDLQSYYSGIDLAKKIREQNKDCFILFLTNLEDKALEIINKDIQPKSYIIKGTNLDIQEVESIFLPIKIEIINRIQNKDNYMSFKKFGEVVYIKYTDILYISSISTMRNTLVVHTKDSEQMVEGTIHKLKKIIDKPYLYTGLKSLIINRNHLASIQRSVGLITFDNGSELEVGISIIDKLNKFL
ncbi:hypothetical protein IGJ02_002627 [Enterococcus sp. DIV0724b]|uniref:LytR/AlgR family response regulator transcription factor n=1 Tax=Enterococcus sp. DIV0724b TaxID=2774694 RepID=UPI003D2FBF14